MNRRNSSSRGGSCGCSYRSQRAAMGETPCETVSDSYGGTMNIYRMSATPWYPCAPGTMAADILSARQESRENVDSQRHDCGCPYAGTSGGSGCSCGTGDNGGCDSAADLRSAVERCEAAAREACQAAKEANQAACEARESACESHACAERAERAACESCECAQAAQNGGRCGSNGGNSRCNTCR
ncbi:MAG TPA: hypothetical protein H9674_04030 [Firmicutes bacterium]|nr:hypothetical protein [Bacillota bacterium]